MSIKHILTVTLIATLFIGTQAGMCIFCSDYKSQFHCEKNKDLCAWDGSCDWNEATQKAIDEYDVGSADDREQPPCSEKKSERSCHGYDQKDTDTICYWEETSCKTVDASSECSSLTKDNQCYVIVGCYWKSTDKKCVKETCAVITDESSCNYFATAKDEAQLCKWNTDKNECQDLAPADADKDTCVAAGHYFTWDGKECINCEGYDGLLATLLGSILVLLV